MNAESGALAPAIRVRHLWHRFGAFDVLRDVSFEVGQGEIFGFIGPNGAGKTTTIRIMATLLVPMAGRVEIAGLDVMTDPEAVRRVIGYMPDHAGVFDRLTIREYLEFFVHAFGVETPVVDAVLELTNLGKIQDRLVATLSKGMRQRLQLARSLLHDPKVLILDEPASNLDPRARIEIRNLLLELRALGKTIFLSSHILTELADVCTSVGILEQGQLVVAGPIGDIARRLEERRAPSAPAQPVIETTGATLGAAPVAAPAALPLGTTEGGVPIPSMARRRLKLRLLGPAEPAAPLPFGGPGIIDVTPNGEQLLIGYVGDDRLVADIVRHLVASGVPVVGVEPERNELERIFLEVTRRDGA